MTCHHRYIDHLYLVQCMERVNYWWAWLLLGALIGVAVAVATWFIYVSIGDEDVPHA